GRGRAPGRRGTTDGGLAGELDRRDLGRRPRAPDRKGAGADRERREAPSADRRQLDIRGARGIAVRGPALARLCPVHRPLPDGTGVYAGRGRAGNYWESGESAVLGSSNREMATAARTTNAGPAVARYLGLP